MSTKGNKNKFKVIEKVGKELSRKTIDFMVNKRIQEYGENTKDFNNSEQESIFFFLIEGNQIKAFGMLKPVIIYYKNAGYPIMGMGNVIAIEKGKGYGIALMEYTKDYLDKNNQVCIGNTHKDNFVFYQKCGFTFFHGFVNRFVYVDNQEKEHRGDWHDYTMFVYDKENKLKEVIRGSGNIIVKVPLW